MWVLTWTSHSFDSASHFPLYLDFDPNHKQIRKLYDMHSWYRSIGWEPIPIPFRFLMLYDLDPLAWAHFETLSKFPISHSTMESSRDPHALSRRWGFWSSARFQHMSKRISVSTIARHLWQPAQRASQEILHLPTRQTITKNPRNGMHNARYKSFKYSK